MLEASFWNRDRDEEDDDRPVRAAIYARTSSPGQRFGYSLEEQVRLCLDWCETLQWIPVYIFQDKEVSAGNTDRPKFQLMASYAQRELFDVLVFWKLDRVSRTLLDAVHLEKELRRSSVALCSLTEQIDTTTSAGRFNFRNLASAAEFERDMIRERTRMGHLARAMEGKWPNNSPPLGYEIHDGRLVVNGSEAVTVRYIFQQYVELRSMPDVALELNQRGEKTRQGKEWCARAVGDILRNRIYIGEYQISGVSKEMSECQILSRDLFVTVTKTRMRFRTSGQSRSEMPKARKIRNVTQILDQYRRFLNQDTKPERVSLLF
jgi:site-specific DNA recombinase